MATLIIKINASLAAMLTQLCHREQVTKSELVRRALLAYASPLASAAAMPSALEMAGDLVGCLSGGPADLAANPAYMADFGRV
jgi:Ribbon-helix-helix protein, copG family